MKNNTSFYAILSFLLFTVSSIGHALGAIDTTIHHYNHNPPSAFFKVGFLIIFRCFREKYISSKPGYDMMRIPHQKRGVFLDFTEF